MQSNDIKRKRICQLDFTIFQKTKKIIMLVFSFYLKYRLYQQIYYNYLLFFLIILLFSKFLILGKHFYKTDLKTKNFKSFYTFEVIIIK